MFYRRKVVLALLQALGGELGRTDLQKHLFLFTRAQEQPAYDFVPHQYGCFSFGADADRAPMIRAGLLADGPTWKKKTKTDYLAELRPDDLRRVAEHKERYGHLRNRELVREVYTSYPYYATRSRIAPEILTEQELAEVEAARPQAHAKAHGTALFTIGYEGRSIEAYLNLLLAHRVAVLCDVRKNPVSMKFGFSKRSLQSAAEKMGIRYVHVPELGIASGKRKALDSPGDYERLFDQYERDTLPGCADELDELCTLVVEDERVAITCFEACHTDCHRSRVAETLRRMPEWEYPVIHL